MSLRKKHVVEILTENLAADEAELLLSSLRWDVDGCVTNHFDERVWLRADLDEKGNRRGITDCCLASHPCEHHAAIAARVKEIRQ